MGIEIVHKPETLNVSLGPATLSLYITGMKAIHNLATHLPNPYLSLTGLSIINYPRFEPRATSHTTSESPPVIARPELGLTDFHPYPIKEWG